MEFKISSNGEIQLLKLVNLTEHEITIFFEDGTSISIPSSVTKETVPRVQTVKEKMGEIEYGINKIPVYCVKYGEVINLPSEEENTLYIVSQMVLQAATNRKDLISPDTSPDGVVRDSNNRIIGVKSFLKQP